VRQTVCTLVLDQQGDAAPVLARTVTVLAAPSPANNPAEASKLAAYRAMTAAWAFCGPWPLPAAMR